MGYIAGAILFCAGYFAPWWKVNLIIIAASINGGSGIEILAVGCAAFAAELAFYEKTTTYSKAMAQIRLGLATGCLLFAAGELLYTFFISNIVQVSFGLPLMVVGAGVMASLDFVYLEPKLRAPLLPAAGLTLLLVLAGAGYRGNEVRKLTGLANLFAGVASPSTTSTPTFSPLANSSAGPEARSDVEVTLNSSTQSTSLQSTQSIYRPRTPDAGKVFLVCNITVNFKGTSGNLDVDMNDFRMTASNKHLYTSSTILEGIQGLNKISAKLLPGGAATGDVVFEVDNDAQAEKIEFAPRLF